MVYLLKMWMFHFFTNSHTRQWNIPYQLFFVRFNQKLIYQRWIVHWPTFHHGHLSWGYPKLIGFIENPMKLWGFTIGGVAWSVGCGKLIWSDKGQIWKTHGLAGKNTMYNWVLRIYVKLEGTSQSNGALDTMIQPRNSPREWRILNITEDQLFIITFKNPAVLAFYQL
jgi:hypothetical protein